MTRSPAPLGVPSSAQQMPFQAFVNPQSSALLQPRSLNASPSNPSEDNEEPGDSDHDGSSSELEEGEIPEAAKAPLPPQPPISSPPLPLRRLKKGHQSLSPQRVSSYPLAHENSLPQAEFAHPHYPPIFPFIPYRYFLIFLPLGIS